MVNIGVKMVRAGKDNLLAAHDYHMTCKQAHHMIDLNYLGTHKEEAP
jgi:hypothetical protein